MTEEKIEFKIEITAVTGEESVETDLSVAGDYQNGTITTIFYHLTKSFLENTKNTFECLSAVEAVKLGIEKAQKEVAVSKIMRLVEKIDDDDHTCQKCGKCGKFESEPKPDEVEA